VLDEAAALRDVTDGVAGWFADLFERHIWRPIVDDGMPPERLPEVAAALERLGPLAERVVHSSLRESLASSAERLLAREASRPA